MKKKILYIWKSEYPWDIRADKICRSLSHFGFEVLIASRWRNEDLEIEDYSNYKIHRIGYQKKRILFEPIPINPFWKKELNNLIINFNPDIIICREIMLGEIAGKIAEKLNIPIIMDMAENYPAAMKLWKKYNSNFLIRSLINDFKVADLNEKRSVKLMDGIITVCEEQNIRLMKKYNIKNPIEIIYNSPEFEMDFDDKLNSGKIIFGHHGYLTAEKSIGTFVEGFLLACKENDNIEFRIIGDGDCLDDYINMIEYSEFKNRITFLGKYNFKELENFLKEIDIGVLPYQHNDFNNYTIHNKIFDYFAFSKPVLVSDVIPLKRVINETQAGFSFDLTDPVKVKKSILEITELNLNKYKANSFLAYKNKYNWNNDSEKLIKFIKKFI